MVGVSEDIPPPDRSLCVTEHSYKLVISYSIPFMILIADGVVVDDDVVIAGIFVPAANINAVINIQPPMIPLYPRVSPSTIYDKIAAPVSCSIHIYTYMDE